MKLLAKTDYALRAAISLARADAYVSSQAIADDQDIPQGFLEHILTDLRRAGIVTSRRGGRGGYQLAIAAEDLKLTAIVAAVDPDLLGAAESGARSTGGTVETLWIALQAELQRFFDSRTLAEVAEPRS